MSLPAAWVDHLFAKLGARYGVAFTRQYADVDPAMVKADWAEVLSGLSGDGIAYGLQHIPADRPPNAAQFRALCVARPAADVPRLPSPKASPDRVRAALRSLKQVGSDRAGLSPAAFCIHTIHSSPNAQKHGLSMAQRDMIASCARILSDPDKARLTALGYAGFELQDERREFVAPEDRAA